MRLTKHEFYRNGPDNQKTPDFVTSFKRADYRQIKKWTPEQVEAALSNIGHAKRMADAFFSDFELLLKSVRNDLIQMPSNITSDDATRFSYINLNP